LRVLVTGGAGYIGSVLAPALLEAGHAVTVLDNFWFKQESLIDCCRFPAFDVVRGDCRDAAAVRPLLKKADLIVPLAALVGAPLCDKRPEEALSVNQGAVELLCKLASPRQRIIFPTTNSGYGIGEKDKFCTEETPLRPISLYGRTKCAAEKAVLERGNAVTFRLATVFGVSPRMRTDLLVNDFVRRAVVDGSLTVFEGHFRRNFIHIRDVARAFLHAIAKFDKMKDRPYNVGLDAANLSKLQLCEAIQKIIPSFRYQEAAVGEDPDKRDYIISNARILATGYRPRVSLAEGIRELEKCYRFLNGASHANV
jgi:nucleoside-diphosphate-sugar epimerase